MGTGDVAPHNYYYQLRGAALHRRGGAPRGFGDSLDYLWSVYTWWLDNFLAGDRGLSTVIDSGRLTHVGKPMSQTLFWALTFGGWMSSFGGSTSSLVKRSRRTSSSRTSRRGRRQPELGARRLIADDQYWPTLGRILGAYARQWDGTRSDREGIRTVGLRVVVQLRRPRRVSIRAIQPEGYPGRLAGQLGGSPASAAAEDGVFAVEGAADPRQLVRGGTLGDATCRLSLPPSDVFILQLEPGTRRLGIGEFIRARYAALRPCAPSVAGSVWDQLNRVCACPQLLSRRYSVPSRPGACTETSCCRATRSWTASWRIAGPP